MKVVCGLKVGGFCADVAAPFCKKTVRAVEALGVRAKLKGKAPACAVGRKHSR